MAHDIVKRLRGRKMERVGAKRLGEEAATEIERLRKQPVPYGAMMSKAFKLEDRDIGWWFNPILVVEDDSGKERLFGLTEIDVDGVSIQDAM